jgi:MFS family permease
MKNHSLGAKKWSVLILFGLIGQIAWTIENMYLNVYIYKTVTYEPQAIAWMVALSAAVATIATLTMGALSDKIAKRKVFMSLGYIVWGLTIIAFAFITKSNMRVIFPHKEESSIVMLTLIGIIALDCIMTFIGSTSNDAAFYGWVNDATREDNRGRAEGVLATMPLLGMLVVFGVLDGFTQSGNWLIFFLIVGIVVTIAGVIGLFIIKDEAVKKVNSHYFKDLMYGFTPKNIKNNWLIYIIFTAIAILGVAQQVFLPYFIIYFEFYVGITDYALLLGGILILASVISFVGGRLVDKYGKKPFLIPSLIVYAVGMIILFFLGQFLTGNMTLIIILTLIFGTLMMGAYLVSLVPLNALARDIMPKGRAGAFSGVRMVFFVLIPMVIGPFIGSSIIERGGIERLDEYGEIMYIPTPYIFLAGGIIALLTLIPIVIILRANLEAYKERKEELEGEGDYETDINHD